MKGERNLVLLQKVGGWKGAYGGIEDASVQVLCPDGNLCCFLYFVCI